MFSSRSGLKVLATSVETPSERAAAPVLKDTKTKIAVFSAAPYVQEFLESAPIVSAHHKQRVADVLDSSRLHVQLLSCCSMHVTARQ